MRITRLRYPGTPGYVTPYVLKHTVALFLSTKEKEKKDTKRAVAIYTPQFSVCPAPLLFAAVCLSQQLIMQWSKKKVRAIKLKNKNKSARPSTSFRALLSPPSRDGKNAPRGITAFNGGERGANNRSTTFKGKRKGVLSNTIARFLGFLVPVGTVFDWLRHARHRHPPCPPSPPSPETKTERRTSSPERQAQSQSSEEGPAVNQ